MMSSTDRLVSATLPNQAGDVTVMLTICVRPGKNLLHDEHFQMRRGSLIVSVNA